MRSEWIYEGAMARLERANERLSIIAAVLTAAIISLIGTFFFAILKDGGKYEK